MAGPVLIFDKSTLQSLNPDEAMWLDNFFSTNVVPPFFIETLADLEKQFKKRRTPEEVVGSLAYKTPDRHSHPNVHHMKLLEIELLGDGKIAMDGRGSINSGTQIKLNNSSGILICETPEQEASTDGSATSSWKSRGGSRKSGGSLSRMSTSTERASFFRSGSRAGSVLSRSRISGTWCERTSTSETNEQPSSSE
jgi:hypothetical protein